MSVKQSWAARQGPARWVRALQLSALSAAFLCGGGYYALSASGAQSSSVLLSGSLPNFTLLLAGRDVIYCYYHQPCKDQNQRQGVIQTANTDTLMLVKVQGSRVNVLSIPRDTTVGEFDRRKPPAEQKVNGKYWDGGPQALVSAVETITGERVDNYLIVRTEEAARVIDALGGLDVTVPAGGIEWVDKAADVNLKLSAGPHHLEGQEAVWYLRVRKGFGDDYGRIDHQKAGAESTRRQTDHPARPGGAAHHPQRAARRGNRPRSGHRAGAAALGCWAQAQFCHPAHHHHSPQLQSGGGPRPARPDLGRPGAAEPADRVTVLLQDASGAGLGAQLEEALHALGYPRVQLTTAPQSGEHSQVFTQSDVKVAQNLADQLNLPRLQGERFPVQPGQVGVLLGSDASSLFAALRTYAPSPRLSAPLP